MQVEEEKRIVLATGIQAEEEKRIVLATPIQAGLPRWLRPTKGRLPTEFSSHECCCD